MTQEKPPGGLTERAKIVSHALSEAARRARFSSRARGAYRDKSFEARRGARAMKIVKMILFAVVVVAPNILSVIYYGFVAANQYLSKAQFTVSSGAIPKLDNIGSVTGVPAMVIMQDTQIVTNFIESRAIVERLQPKIDLREIYGASSIDWWSRLPKDSPIEKFMIHWAKMTETSIAFPSGVVSLTVKAFSPEDAKRVAETIIALCEEMLNSLNERMRRDMVASAEQDFKRAGHQLKEASAKLEKARNAEGVIDVKQTGLILASLFSQTERDLLKAQNDYQTRLRYISEQAPQMRVLKSRIAALGEQVEMLKGQLTSQGGAESSKPTLSATATRLSGLGLEQEIMEKRYASASMLLEAARVASDRQMLYLQEVVAPALPEDARYPRRVLAISMVFASSLILWGAAVGLLSFLRNNMA